MKTKKIYFTISIVFIGALFLFILNLGSQAKRKSGSADSPDSKINAHASNISPTRGQVDYDMKEIENESLDALFKGANNAEFQETIRRSQSALSQPLDFHGRIIDQYGNGIPAVRVSCIATRLAVLDSGDIKPGNYLFEVKSDEEGLFSITGFNAMYLSIDDLNKDGYLQTRDEFINFSYNTRSHTLRYSQSKPKVFHMWKMDGEVEPLVKQDDIYKVLADGIPVDIHLNKTGKDFGTVRIIIKADGKNHLSEGKHWGWSFTAEVPHGGIQLTDSPMPYLAPESGYESRIYFEMDANNPKWDSSKRFTAYMISGYPPSYSSVIFDVNLSSQLNKNKNFERTVFLGFEIKTNPSGARSLVPTQPLR